MILAVVDWPWRRASPWRSYTKEFPDEAAFLAWWHSLPDGSFTRTQARVTAYRAEQVDLLAPWAPPREDGPQPCCLDSGLPPCGWCHRDAGA